MGVLIRETVEEVTYLKEENNYGYSYGQNRQELD